MDDTHLEYGILQTVEQAEGDLTQREIAKTLGISVASVNFALRMLAVKGFIKITRANPRRLKYHLTPRGLLQKSMLAYNFLKRQSSLYEEVRQHLLERLKELSRDGIKKVALYGWTPFTEASILFLISEGMEVTTVYLPTDPKPGAHCNRIPFRHIKAFEPHCDALVLLEPRPDGSRIGENTRVIACFPDCD